MGSVSPAAHAELEEASGLARSVEPLPQLSPQGGEAGSLHAGEQEIRKPGVAVVAQPGPRRVEEGSSRVPEWYLRSSLNAT